MDFIELQKNIYFKSFDLDHHRIDFTFKNFNNNDVIKIDFFYNNNCSITSCLYDLNKNTFTSFESWQGSKLFTERQKNIIKNKVLKFHREVVKYEN